MEKYICKIATLDELIRKCDYEIKRHPGNKMWENFKNRAIKNYMNGNAITYIGSLNDEIICEATAIIKEDGFEGDISDYSSLLEENRAYLSGFRTNKEYEGQGYFLKLYSFMESDLKKKGYNSLSLGVEPNEVRNIQIYFKLGFVNYIKTTIQSLPQINEKIETINFYYKNI